MQDSIGLQQSILRGDFDRAYAGNGTDVETAKKTAAELIEKLTAALSGAPATPLAETDVSQLAPVFAPPPAGANRPASWAQWPNQQGLMTDPKLRQTFAKDDPFYLPPGDYGTGKAARDRIMLPVAGQFQTYAFNFDSDAWLVTMAVVIFGFQVWLPRIRARRDAAELLANPGLRVDSGSNASARSSG